MAAILLIDDDDDLRSMVAELLEVLGHEVRIGRNGMDGLRLLSEALPQLVISDVEMPMLDGPAMIYRMFLDNLGRENIPVIVVSGIANLSELAAAVGTPYYLGKPFNLKQLEQLIDRALAEAIPPRPKPMLGDRPAI